MTARTTDVLVVGSGIAGCAAALAAAREGAEVTVASKATRPEGASSWWAQGGIAVSKGDPERFKRDILDASDGTADPEAVDVLVGNANDAVEDVLLGTLDVEFDRTASSDEGPAASTDGRAAGPSTRDGFDFGREAAHSDDRILHVDASTGKAIHVPFLNHLDGRDGVEIREDTAALELIRHEGRVYGAMLERDGDVAPTFAGATVLATGGVGDLYPGSTNPAGATADGIGMAALAGANVADMEYVQFHPTVYRGAARGATQGDGSPDGDSGQFLVSEAVRGEGAILRNGDGERFMPRYHGDAELAPRDVVARAVTAEREATGEVRLDVSPLAFAESFPDLAALCADNGVDYADGIPVAPAEHFLCGGVAVDDRGRSGFDEPAGGARLGAAGRCRRGRPRAHDRRAPRVAGPGPGAAGGLRPREVPPAPSRDGRDGRARAQPGGPRTRPVGPPAAEGRGRRLRPHANLAVAVRTPPRRHRGAVDRPRRRRERRERRHSLPGRRPGGGRRLSRWFRPARSRPGSARTSATTT